jgi:excisionase family DNA binding protein
MTHDAERSPRSFTVPELAVYLRVGVKTIREWIRKGELTAVNVGSLNRTRLIITPDALADFIRRRSVPVEPQPRRRRRRERLTNPEKDWFPD